MGRFERGLAKLSPNSTATRSLAVSHLPDTAAPAPEDLFITKPLVILDASGWLTLDELITMDGLANPVSRGSQIAGAYPWDHFEPADPSGLR